MGFHHASVFRFGQRLQLLCVLFLFPQGCRHESLVQAFCDVSLLLRLHPTNLASLSVSTLQEIAGRWTYFRSFHLRLIRMA